MSSDDIDNSLDKLFRLMNISPVVANQEPSLTEHGPKNTGNLERKSKGLDGEELKIHLSEIAAAEQELRDKVLEQKERISILEAEKAKIQKIFGDYNIDAEVKLMELKEVFDAEKAKMQNEFGDYKTEAEKKQSELVESFEAERANFQKEFEDKKIRAEEDLRRIDKCMHEISSKDDFVVAWESCRKLLIEVKAQNEQLKDELSNAYALVDIKERAIGFHQEMERSNKRLVEELIESVCEVSAKIREGIRDNHEGEGGLQQGNTKRDSKEQADTRRDSKDPNSDDEINGKIDLLGIGY
ncbi:hypothetical protein BS50DRAFT_659806 [Corynespora cassiicola Philippines]|uniref:Uncharacterized protein n=1 Tax=Corynespora cassiicola Philippines TaxID=1448308 RepID=A0A2T2NZS9_CORCC|nr:hypothetical protein BS50DRAFT_659806 [Corynespora cassiicola Philippines]